MWKFALSIIVNSQGKIKENFITSACPIFLLRISRLTRYSLYSSVESNGGDSRRASEVKRIVCCTTFMIFSINPRRHAIKAGPKALWFVEFGPLAELNNTQSSLHPPISSKKSITDCDRQCETPKKNFEFTRSHLQLLYKNVNGYLYIYIYHSVCTSADRVLK